MKESRRSSETSIKRSESTDDALEKSSNERIPLEDLIDSPTKLAGKAVNSLSWDLVVGMLPDYLKTRTKEDVIKLVAEEIDGWSRRRLTAVLDGDDYPSTSEGSASESDYTNDDGEYRKRSNDSHSERDTSASEPLHRESPYNSRSHTTSRSQSRSPSQIRSSSEDEIEIYE